MRIAFLFLALTMLGCRSMWLEADLGPLEGTGPHPRFGFVTEMKEERLWVFRWGSKDLADFRAKGEPAKSVTKIRGGPGGVTIRAPDFQTIYDYMYGTPGFTVWLDKEGRLTVIRNSDTKSLDDFYKRKGELGKSVTKVGAGPDRMTVRAPDGRTIEDYLRSYRPL